MVSVYEDSLLEDNEDVRLYPWYLRSSSTNRDSQPGTNLQTLIQITLTRMLPPHIGKENTFFTFYFEIFPIKHWRTKNTSVLQEFLLLNI